MTDEDKDRELWRSTLLEVLRNALAGIGFFAMVVIIAFVYGYKS